MNPTVLLSIVLTLALIAMFAFGLYSLSARYRPRPVPPSPATAAGMGYSFAVHPSHIASPPFVAADLNEWEANAHWHESNACPDSGDHDESQESPESTGQRTSRNFDDSRRELHEAWASEAHATSASFASASHADVDAITAPLPDPAPRCPQCRSSRIDVLNRARKAGGTIGSVAGATSGISLALAGAETGAVAGAVLGPVGSLFGGLAGAVIAGLVGSAAGCAAGSAVGAAIDDNVLDNHACLSCGHTFSATRS